MDACVANGDVDISVAEVADESLATGIEEGLGILRFGPCLENLLVVEDDGAVSGWKIVALFFFLGFRFVYLPPVLGFDLKTSDLVNLDTKDSRRVVV